MTVDPKALLTHAYAELAKGDGRPFNALLADNVRYVVQGHTSWSGVYEGKDAMIQRCIRPVWRRFQDGGRIIADRIFGDGDFVVIEGHGEGITTREGRPYNNRYCFVFRFDGDRIVEMVEYMDTELAAVLGAPGEGEGPETQAA